MTATVVTEFKKLLSKIPKETFKNIWLFPIRRDRKNPDVPSGTVLKGNTAYRLTVRDCINRLKSGRNVGIYALSGGLMFLDLDVEKGKFKASEEFLLKITPSFCVRTRNGGLQYYYLNDGCHSNQLIKENGIEIGELRTDWQYVVSAGSYVTPDKNSSNGDGTYRVINSLPIVSFLGLDGYVKKRDTKKEETKLFHKKTEINDEIDIKDYKKKLRRKGKKQRKMTEKEIKELILKIKGGKR